ncbi:hypothetical protein MHU86_22729 [Fragilaria crotonensis]|nr:hypothetical protein MHU86_22729 [Fragilaria crotonensis]
MSEDDSHRSSINILAIINTAFTKIRVDQKLQPRLWNKWLPAETWVEALKASNLIDETLTLNVRSFNSAMARSKSEFNGLLIERFDGSNTTGVFRVTFQKQKYYYITKQNAQVSYPKPLDNKWKADVLAGAKDVLRMRATRSNTSAVTNDKIFTALVSKSEQRKRRFISISADNNNKRHNTDAISETLVSPPDIPIEDEQQNPIAVTCADEDVPPVTVILPPKMFYWNSQDASNLFGIKLELPAQDDVRKGLMLRIKLLQSVSQDQNGWRNVIEGRDPDNICSGYDIFAIRGRSMTLCLAYQIAIVNMNVWTWEECCTEACQQLNRLGMEQATHHRTIQDWNNEFRTCGSFSHPNHSVRCGKRPMPPLFIKYPMAMDDIIAFGVKNLTTLTVEVVHSFCHDQLIPRL